MRHHFIVIMLGALLATACAGSPGITPQAVLPAASAPTTPQAATPAASVSAPPTPGNADATAAATAMTSQPATSVPPLPTASAVPVPMPSAQPTATARAAGLAGLVTDVTSGKPVARAWVYLGDTITRTDDLGQYSFSATVPTATLTVMAPGFARFNAPVSAVTGTTALKPFSARAVYLPYGLSAQVAQRDRMFDLINRTALNAVVIDIKSDDGFVWRSNVPLAHRVGSSDDSLDLQAFVAAAHARGIYVIGRFTMFKDTVLARGQPDLAIHATGGGLWRDPPGNAYADPFVTTTWHYYADLAVDMAGQGVDEIQYDYVRFPVDGDLRTAVYHATADAKTRPAQITQFVTYMEQQLRPHKVFISADIFGRVVWHPADPDTGQILEQIAPHVDYISPMLYPSGFNAGSGGFDRPPAHPYEIIKQSLQQSNDRVRGLPVRVRPWLQAFQDYAWGIPYGLPEYQAQRRAADELGTAGWMYWNPLAKYDERAFLPKK